MIYTEFLKAVQPGDIIFSYKKGNIFSELIWKISKWFMKLEKEPRVSHSFIYIGNDLIAESTTGYGAIIRSLYHYNPKKYVLYHGIVNKDYDKQKLIQLAKESSAEYGYSYFTIIWLLIKKIFFISKSIDEKNAVVCSEFVIMLFNKVGLELVPGKPQEEISPLEIFNSTLISTQEITE